MIDTKGKFTVTHQFTADEGHAASMLQGHDGYLYGCAVWLATSLPRGPLPSGILYRMAPWGQDFQVLYTFSLTNASGQNADGADCYELLVEPSPGVFYAMASRGGSNRNGVVFKYSLSTHGVVEVVHDFSAMNSAGQNLDGAVPVGRLAIGPDGTLYSNTEAGGGWERDHRNSHLRRQRHPRRLQQQWRRALRVDIGRLLIANAIVDP